MKILKSAVVAFSLAIAMGSFSTTANAAVEDRTSFKPLDAVKAVQSHIAAAVAAINNGADANEVSAHIKSASDGAKEINANDKVARENSKAIKHLKAAQASAKVANLQEAKEHLGKANEVLEDLKKLI